MENDPTYENVMDHDCLTTVFYGLEIDVILSNLKEGSVHLIEGIYESERQDFNPYE